MMTLPAMEATARVELKRAINHLRTQAQDPRADQGELLEMAMMLVEAFGEYLRGIEEELGEASPANQPTAACAR